MESISKTGLKYRLIVSLLFFCFVLFNTLFEVGVTQEEPVGIEDKIHKLLLTINSFFRIHNNLKNVLIIISNAILDVSTIFLAIIWLAFAKNLRIFFSIFIFFAIKLATQAIFLVRPPQDNLIKYPGFPSLVYSYNINNYFFFSGTSGFSFVLIYEFFSYAESVKFTKFFGYLNLVNLFFFSFLSLCFYSLYTADILIGIITAHYAIRLSRYLHPVFDGKFFATETNFEADFFERLFNFLRIKNDKENNISGEQEKITEESLKDGKRITNKEKESFEVSSSAAQNHKDKDIVYNDECDII